MTRSRFLSSAIAACALAVGCIGHAVASAWADFTSAARSAWDMARAWLSPPEPAAAEKHETQPEPRVAFVAARSFLAKMMRRIRPLVTPQWRMCPSA